MSANEPTQMLDVRIWRGAKEGEFIASKVPLAENRTVLDVVTWVQRHRRPDLAYRFSCRVGVCGSCAMTVTGRARWTCRSHVKDVVEEGRLTIEPLRNMPHIKDLVCDPTPFFDRRQRAGVFADPARVMIPCRRSPPTLRKEGSWMRVSNVSIARSATALAMSFRGERIRAERIIERIFRRLPISPPLVSCVSSASASRAGAGGILHRASRRIAAGRRWSLVIQAL